MVTANLANMPAVAGFYAFIAGSLVFALFGRHPRLSVGADPPSRPCSPPGSWRWPPPEAEDYTHLVSAVSLMVGAVLVGAGLLRLGWIATSCLCPLSTGSWPALGSNPGQAASYRPWVARWGHDDHRPGPGRHRRVRSPQRLDLRHRRRRPRHCGRGREARPPDPGALIAVVAATVLVGAGGLTHHGVRVLGPSTPACPLWRSRAPPGTRWASWWSRQ